MRIASNVSNIAPGGNIPNALQGTDVEDLNPADMMDNLIVAGNDGEACRASTKAMFRIDGANSPPDLVFGSGADVVYGKLGVVFNALECDRWRGRLGWECWVSFHSTQPAPSDHAVE